MRAILIPADGGKGVGEWPMEEVDIPEGDMPTLNKLNELVGGSIEMLSGVQSHYRRPDMCAFINEDGKRLRLRSNTRATWLYAGHIVPGDVIAGPMVLCGVDGPETVAVPDDFTIRTIFTIIRTVAGVL